MKRSNEILRFTVIYLSGMREIVKLVSVVMSYQLMTTIVGDNRLKFAFISYFMYRMIKSFYCVVKGSISHNHNIRDSLSIARYLFYVTIISMIPNKSMLGLAETLTLILIFLFYLRVLSHSIYRFCVIDYVATRNIREFDLADIRNLCLDKIYSTDERSIKQLSRLSIRPEFRNVVSVDKVLIDKSIEDGIVRQVIKLNYVYRPFKGVMSSAYVDLFNIDIAF